MRSFWARRASKILFVALVLVPVGLTVFSLIVMWLWNWLAPPVFGWHTINFWQALGIFVLSKVLFGGPRGWGRGMRGRMRARMEERWEQMTPEEREKFRKGMQGFCRGSRSRNEPEGAQSGPAQA